MRKSKVSLPTCQHVLSAAANTRNPQNEQSKPRRSTHETRFLIPFIYAKIAPRISCCEQPSNSWIAGGIRMFRKYKFCNPLQSVRGSFFYYLLCSFTVPLHVVFPGFRTCNTSSFTVLRGVASCSSCFECTFVGSWGTIKSNSAFHQQYFCCTLQIYIYIYIWN